MSRAWTGSQHYPCHRPVMTWLRLDFQHDLTFGSHANAKRVWSYAFHLRARLQNHLSWSEWRMVFIVVPPPWSLSNSLGHHECQERSSVLQWHQSNISVCILITIKNKNKCSDTIHELRWLVCCNRHTLAQQLTVIWPWRTTFRMIDIDQLWHVRIESRWTCPWRF